MPLIDWGVKRDRFEFDEDIHGALSFPCLVCVHRVKAHDENPCRVCDHNVSSVDDEINA